MVGLTDVAKKKPGKFSLGMSQRLGIAAALLGKPKYLMLDEPANGLDPEGIAWLRQFIKDYADQGNAVFVSSHLLSEMALMADNVVVIGKGKLIAQTTIQGIISKSSHASVFVRASSLPKLERLAKQHSWSFQKTENGLDITGATTDEIGKEAFADGLAILELASRGASLEDAFLELTAGSEEYRAGAKGSK
ncbi:MAG TPA: ATP-binding cassette domain-containing protein, partial [Candidatus Saccharimonadales bacterium]|nr:ATP-binding cassette domain-containing protein [Candidatus Saccharimonadales bacterium]